MAALERLQQCKWKGALRLPIWLLLSCSSLLLAPFAQGAAAELKDISINGGLQDGKARLVIEALLSGLSGDRERVIFTTTLQHSMQVSRESIHHSINATLDILQGDAKELPLTITGEGEITKVTGEGLLDWSVRQETSGGRTLVLRPRKGDKPITQLVVTILAEREYKSWGKAVTPLSLAPTPATLGNGFVKVEFAPELDVQATNVTGLVPIEPKLLPQGLRAEVKTDEPEPLAFRFHGAAYALPLQVSVSDPEGRRVVLRDFKLQGRLSDTAAIFTLTAIAQVKNPKGGTLNLLSGAAALTALEPHPDWRLKFEKGQFALAFDRAGEFPIRLQFNAGVRQAAGWNTLDFRVASSALQPVVFQGLAADTQFQFSGGARPERSGSDFVSYLPADGVVKLSWKEARVEEEGKLFYSAEMLSQISLSPGLMRQVALLEGKVMQGELSRLVVTLRGQGNVTRVQGADVLSWKVEPSANAEERRLEISFNQPQKDRFLLQVQVQTELGAFPQAVEAVQLRPEAATRFAGHFRVVNEGAVRLEVLESTGLSQVSPEQFPETETTKALFTTRATQRFAFRFAGAAFALRVQADNVLPELSVSEVLSYHLGETELDIDAELELDIREAPVRELLLRVPRGYAIARLTVAGLSDYFLTDTPAEPDVQLRLVYGQPVSGRQVVQLRLERNAPLGQATWALPRVELTRAKSTRGHISVSADAGFRLSPDRLQALTEIATAFFPKKIAGIQSAFRLSEPVWEAVMRVERLAQSIQADVVHLFSIGEGIAYGSTTMHYGISGAPISAFQVELSGEYFNVEFTGKDVRNWQRTTNGYLVQLHTPMAGAYTLLVTYERPFKAQGETLTFTGARPLDASTEQGHTLVISAYQFDVEAQTVSPGLLALQTAEVPSEYRLLFDAPILAAYRYSARPFNLQLTLRPLQQKDTLSLVVDRAALNTRISKDGEVVTDARYFVKNRGNTHLRLMVPAEHQLWSVTVNGVTAVPVKDGAANLIPLPTRADPNAVQTLDLKLAARSANARRVKVGAPVVAAPVLLAEWKIEPDANQRLVYRRGTLAPAGGVPDISGFAGLANLFRGRSGPQAGVQLFASVALVGLALLAWRWATREGTYKHSLRHLAGTGIGLLAMIFAYAALASLASQAAQEQHTLPRDLTFLAPVQQSGSALTIEVGNFEDQFSIWGRLGDLWPAVFALAVWLYALATERTWLRGPGIILGWTLLAWAVLRCPNGAPAFLAVPAAFLIVHVIFPALRRLWQLPPKPVTPPASDTSAAVASLILTALLWLGLGQAGAAAPAPNRSATETNAALRREAPIAETVTQTIRVEEKFAIANVRIRWQAFRGQALPLLSEPAVLTRISYPTNALQLVQLAVNNRRTHRLLARQDGTFEVELEFQLHAIAKDGEHGFALPTHPGLVNQLTLTLVDLDVDVTAPQAVSTDRETVGSNTVARLVLPPVNDPWVGWKPRSRDVKREKAVFYAELFHLFAPAAGVIEGAHFVQVRPAQGEVAELTFDVPGGATVTDVLDPAPVVAPADAKNPKAPGTSSSFVSVWRFDPDTRKLRVTLNPPLSRPFTLLVRSQVAAGPLPFEQSVGLLNVNQAAGQVGALAVATGSEVQLDNVTAETFTPINLEDFPSATLQPLSAQLPGLALRRAYRYTDPRGTASVKASPVQPDLRIEVQQTLSLSEDRTLLAANLNAAITRSGLFRISFALPPGLEVETISGPALSHWTELRAADSRVVTLHLKGRTEGQTQFAISLAGPGTKPTNGWVAPRLIIREASKQSGQLVVVPEHGLRLQVSGRDGVTQLDPQKSGIRQKGVLAFRILQQQWNLALNLEQVDAWVQVTSLQHATVTEAQVKIAANLQYQIENTGLKALRIRIPTNAESVRFRGDQVADFLPVPGQVQDGLQTWEVKLHRRVLGKYLLQLNYQTLLAAQATNVLLAGVQALDVNLQRGFLTIESGGRLQAHADNPPAALQNTEPQSIPRALRQDIASVSANHTFRLVEPAFRLPLRLERHDAAELQPARVNNVTLTSVISDEGVMLTEVRLELVPGDNRLLRMTLPKEGQFWFAFVNQNGVWPWRQGDRILIPLEQQSRPDKPTVVELYYSSQIGAPAARALDVQLQGPKFDLPLEKLVWRVYLNDKWHLTDWTGSLQLQEEQTLAQPAKVDLDSYLQSEDTRKREKTKEAEQLMSLGNRLLEGGDPGQARRAFQSAFGLSTHDDAFNEDARVQLHNLKVQQALVGLNAQQAAAAGEQDGAASKLGELRARKNATYTQQEAKQIFEGNTAEDNAAFTRLAERIIQQQDAAVSAPAAIRASIPQQGRLLTFRRAVQVQKDADLTLGLEATAARTASSGTRLLVLAATFALLALLAGVSRGIRAGR